MTKHAAAASLLFGLACALVGLDTTTAAAHIDTAEHGLIRIASATADALDASVGDAAVAFWSTGGDLVAGDTNGQADVFVYTFDHVLTRASVSSSGAQGNGFSWKPALSTNSRYVAFESTASNLVPSDTNGIYDIFVRDLQAGVTERVSVASGGAQANSLSFSPSISADGRYISFESAASNLVAGDTNGRADAFVHDRVNRTTVRVSIPTCTRQPNGLCLQWTTAQANGASTSARISGDGRHVTFASQASNLVPGDTNGVGDVFVRHLATQVTERVSVTWDTNSQISSPSGRPTISSNGSVVGFETWVAPGRSEAWFRELGTPYLQRMRSDYNGDGTTHGCRAPAVSPDGEVRVGECEAGGTWNINSFEIISPRCVKQTIFGYGCGEVPNGSSYGGSVNNAQVLAFHSNSSNLVADDRNGRTDLFLIEPCAYPCNMR